MKTLTGGKALNSLLRTEALQRGESFFGFSYIMRWMLMDAGSSSQQSADTPKSRRLCDEGRRRPIVSAPNLRGKHNKMFSHPVSPISVYWLDFRCSYSSLNTLSAEEGCAHTGFGLSCDTPTTESIRPHESSSTSVNHDSSD